MSTRTPVALNAYLEPGTYELSLEVTNGDSRQVTQEALQLQLDRKYQKRVKVQDFDNTNAKRLKVLVEVLPASSINAQAAVVVDFTANLNLNRASVEPGQVSAMVVPVVAYITLAAIVAICVSLAVISFNIVEAVKVAPDALNTVAAGAAGVGFAAFGVAAVIAVLYVSFRKR
jgi:hypothetical protein